jgi:hypothetical protein
MKKDFFWFILFLMVFGTAGVKAQVTIGSTQEPHEGAILDLKSTDKGLKLPVILLDNISNFQLDGNETSAVGMVVYNAKTTTIGGKGVGIYVWDGTKWLFTGMLPTVSLTKITITPNPASVIVGNNIQFNVISYPTNATNPSVTWTVRPSGSATITQSGLLSSLAAGQVWVVAKSTENINIADSVLVTIIDKGTCTQTTLTISNGQTWMLTSSALGKAYKITSAGGLYSATDAASACVYPWRLPSLPEVSALDTYLNSNPYAWALWCCAPDPGASTWQGNYCDTEYLSPPSQNSNVGSMWIASMRFITWNTSLNLTQLPQKDWIGNKMWMANTPGGCESTFIPVRCVRD